MRHLMCLLLSQDANTPLHIAAMKNMSAVVDVLLQSKANADCVNKVLQQYASHSLQYTRDWRHCVIIKLCCRDKNCHTNWLQMES